MVVDLCKDRLLFLKNAFFFVSDILVELVYDSFGRFWEEEFAAFEKSFVLRDFGDVVCACHFDKAGTRKGFRLEMYFSDTAITAYL